MVVTALGLDGLHDDGARRHAVVEDEVLDLGEGGGFSGGVLLSVLLERVAQLREGGLGPVEGGNVELVDGLGPGGGEGAKQAAVEARAERQDRQALRGAGALIVHGGGHLLLGELNGGAASLPLPPPHERRLVRRLVGVGARHRREHLVQPLGRHLEYARLEDLGPVVRWEVAQRRPVDDGVHHLLALSSCDEGRVVVPERDGRDLGVAMKPRRGANVSTDTPRRARARLGPSVKEHTTQLPR